MRAKCIKSLELDSNIFVKGKHYDFEVEMFCIPDVTRQLTFSIKTNVYGPTAVFYDKTTCDKEKYPYCFDDYFVIDDPHVHIKTPIDDIKEFTKSALKSKVNPFERQMEFDKRYGKHRPSIMVDGIVNAEWGTAAGPSEKVTVLTDPFHLGSLKIGDRVKVIIIKEE